MATLATIQKLLTSEDCGRILKRSLKFPTQLFSYRVTKCHDDVAGFLGDHLSLTIKYISNNIKSQTTYFMKTLPQFNLNQLDYVIEAGIFQKEVILYQNLLSALIEISHFGPRCFLVKENLIVLEDLVAKGFKMNNRLIYLKEEHCIGMLKTLAKFHVSTIVYEKQQGLRLDERFKEEIKENCFSFIKGQPRNKWLISNTQCVTELMKLVPVEDCNIDDICTKFEKFIFEEMESFLRPSKKFRNVLVHDDLWCNNMLFSDNNECIFVDFQLVRYTPPSMDLLTCLYLNLDSTYVENNLSTFVDIYYSFLVEELNSHSLDCAELPRKEFEESLEWYKLPAFTEVAFYGTHIYVSQELCNQIVENWSNYSEFSFLNRSKFAVKEFKENPQYCARLSGPLTLLIKTLAHRN